MLYKVTPNLTPIATPSEPAAEASREPRKRRKSAIFDADGNEVLITMMCLKCKSMKPLAMFGLRKMADGAIRNQPWCRTCRSGASKKKAEAVVEVVVPAPAPVVVAAPPAPKPLSVLEQLLAGPVL